MKLDIFPDEKAVAKKAAEVIAGAARDAVVASGKFVFAVSGGRTPWLMLHELAGEKVPWEQVQLFQVDERIAPPESDERNLTHLCTSLLGRVPLKPEQIHAMPVESKDLQKASHEYDAKLRQFAGSPPVIDLVHLGLGSDGHTASLVPNDPVLCVDDADVALTGIYQWRGRMTLTYPAINRAKLILWIVTGAEKAEMLPRLLAGDRSIPAGRVEPSRAVVLADRAAAEKLHG